MKVKVVKAFKSKDRLYNKEEVINVPVDVAIELSKKELITALEATAEEQADIAVALFKELLSHSYWLCQFALPETSFPDEFEQMKALYKQLYFAFLNLDYGSFLRTIQTIEKQLQALIEKWNEYMNTAF